MCKWSHDSYTRHVIRRPKVGVFLYEKKACDSSPKSGRICVRVRKDSLTSASLPGIFYFIFLKIPSRNLIEFKMPFVFQQECLCCIDKK